MNIPPEPMIAPHSFDLVRITKAKQVLGIHGDTIKAYRAEGFNGIYKRGKAVFVSKSELEAWLKGKQ